MMERHEQCGGRGGELEYGKEGVMEVGVWCGATLTGEP
jgi:hypothetical protein